jgi:hypothetical protein
MTPPSRITAPPPHLNGEGSWSANIDQSMLNKIRAEVFLLERQKDSGSAGTHSLGFRALRHELHGMPRFRGLHYGQWNAISPSVFNGRLGVHCPE